MLNMSPEMMGLLGMKLMQASQPTTDPNAANSGMLNPMMIAQFLSNKGPGKSPIPSAANLSNTSYSNSSNSAPVDREAYLAQLKQSAASAYPDNPLLQQIAMTQAIHESGLNPSKLATNNNNYFGIKGNGANMPTTEYINGVPQTRNESFAANDSIDSSFNQYKDLLSNKRYSSVTSASTPQDAFVQLQKAGYATDPRYAQKLSKVYSRYVQPLYSS